MSLSSQSSAAVAVLQIDGMWHRLYGAATRLVASEPGEVPSVLAAVEAAADGGKHVAGFVTYEAGAAFGIDCHAPPEGLPLAEFAVFDHMERYDPRQLAVAAAAAERLDWEPSMPEEVYTAAVRRIRERLAAGDTYQVNLTFPLTTSFAGDPLALFARLARAQRSSYAAYLDFGRFVVCSASPELFFARDGERVTMRPMKGTATRGRTLEEDRRRSAALRKSPKERAENLMVVDMVRNDLGKVARTGSVKVPELFRVEKFPTVLQMTSTVTAETSASLPELFAATFPCASITGAPKVRTAQLIRTLEAGPRGVYSGAVGYVGPGRKARFNVAIRTATVDRDLARATYSVGSGIVWDSRPGREYAECLAKAAVLAADSRPFALLETLRWDPEGGFALLERHLRRQASSARFFGIPYDRSKVRQKLASVTDSGVPLRVRLIVDEDGEICIESAPLGAAGEAPVRVGFARRPVDSSDTFLYHKTTRRDVYEAAMTSRPDCDQVLLWTATGRVTETNIGNVAVRREDGWVTPPVSDGLLAGTLRAELLAKGRLSESSITREELAAATEIAVFNSVRGWQAATFVPDGPPASPEKW
ncbi:MAG: aminodeoxychorismate synthase component I [Dehalococcoidia bacterium]|nr:aminodeoxychorismate synthase component I [Dehalococcoidia bacterium]